jgi:DNA-binding transcriptional LysR family regulator
MTWRRKTVRYPYSACMELRHLRYFVAVAERLSFTKGAKKLRLAQPSLTRQIKDLEEEIGVRLLDRTKREVSLTEEGKSFLADAKRVLAHSAEIIESVQRLRHHKITAFNVGYVADLFYSSLPITLAALQRSLPTVSINLFDMTRGDQFRALEEGKIDLGFVGLRELIEERGLQFRSIASHKTVAALAKSNRLAKKTIIELRDLKPIFFIGMSEKTYPGYRNWLTTTCQRVGFMPKVLQDADIERTVIRAVAAGLGVALLPDHVKKLPRKNVVFRPLAPTVMTESCVAWKGENTSMALREYLKIVKEQFSAMAGE